MKDRDNPPAPYALWLGDATDTTVIKTGTGLVKWRPDDVNLELHAPGCTATVGVSRMEVDVDSPTGLGAALALLVALGVQTVVNVHNPSGPPPKDFLKLARFLLAQGISVASGTHWRLSRELPPQFTEAVRGARTYDFRHVERTYPLASGRPRRGVRVLTVGGDGVIGKKYAALALRDALVDAGVPCTFCATGQTGRLLCREGDRFIVMDTIPVDFAAGAAEWLSPDHEDPGHVYVIEGQASVFHPAWGPPAWALMLGSQPDLLLYCVDFARKKMLFTDQPVADPHQDAWRQCALAGTVNPQCDLLGFAVNQSGERDQSRVDALASLLPTFDPSEEPGEALEAAVRTIARAVAWKRESA